MIFVFKVEFPREVYIEVYETSDPGSINKLGVWNGDSYVTVYSGQVVHRQQCLHHHSRYERHFFTFIMIIIIKILIFNRH